MSDPKYVVITAANCVAANRSAALENMGDFAQDLHNGTDVMAIRYGIVPWQRVKLIQVKLE